MLITGSSFQERNFFDIVFIRFRVPDGAFSPTVVLCHLPPRPCKVLLAVSDWIFRWVFSVQKTIEELFPFYVELFLKVGIYACEAISLL